LALTVPSAPRPQKTARTRSSGSMSKDSTGSEVCHIVDNAHGEVVAGFFAAHLVEDGANVGGAELLGRQPVAAGQDPRLRARTVIAVDFVQSRHHIHIKGVADRTGFLGPVQHRDCFGGRR